MTRISKTWLAHMVTISVITGICALPAFGISPNNNNNVAATLKGVVTHDLDVEYTGDTEGVDPLGCRTDLDDDGRTGFTDLVRVLNNWGDCKDCEEDFDDDTLVGFSDLVNVLTQWGPCLITP